MKIKQPNPSRKLKTSEDTSLVLIEKSHKKLNALSKNARYKPNVIDAGRRMLNLYENSVIDRRIVRLVIPPDVMKKLGSGRVSITKGVARYKNGEIYKHLPELKPSKITKAINIVGFAFLAYEILEDKILDEKLQAIFKIVKRIEAKVDAQNKGMYKSAINQFNDLGLYRNKQERDKRVSNTMSMLDHAEHIYKELYENAWEDLNFLINKYTRAYITNRSEIDKIDELKNELLEYISIILSCKLTKIKMLIEYQNEYELAQAKSYILQEYFLKQIKRFEENFGSDAVKLFHEKYRNPVTIIDWKGRARIIAKLSDSCNETLEALSYTRDKLICIDLSIPEVVTAIKS